MCFEFFQLHLYKQVYPIYKQSQNEILYYLQMASLEPDVAAKVQALMTL